MMNSKKNIGDIKAIILDNLGSYFHINFTENIKKHEITSVQERSFSIVMFINITTDKSIYKYVSKTVLHHYVNKKITEETNQALVEYNLLKELYPKYKKIDGCSVPKPVMVIPEIETMIMEYVNGELLVNESRFARYLASKKHFSILNDHYYKLGQWLKYFHQFSGITKSDKRLVLKAVDKCKDRLGLIMSLQDSRIPLQFDSIFLSLLNRQIDDLGESDVLSTGRHSDFGGWNVIVNNEGVVVIDFLGYETDLLTLDIQKMLMNFEDEKNYFTYSNKRLNDLRKAFLNGYGPLPNIPKPILILSESLYRISSIWGTISNKDLQFHHKVERNICLKKNINWFNKNPEENLLWNNKNL